MRYKYLLVLTVFLISGVLGFVFEDSDGLIFLSGLLIGLGQGIILGDWAEHD